MSGADRLEDGFPHGTVDGYQQGCRGGFCPAGNDHGLSCRRAKQLTAGDYRFQRLVRAGLTPGEIALELGLAPETHEAPKRVKTVEPDGIEEDDVEVEGLDDQEEEEIVVEKVAAPTPKDVAPKFEVFNKPTAARLPEPTADDEKRRRAEIRKWAADNGIQIGAKGRIPQAVVIGWLNDDPTLGGTITPKRKLGKMKPTVQPPAVSEPVENELADIQSAVNGDGPHTPTPEEVEALWADTSEPIDSEAAFAVIVVDAIAEASEVTAELERTQAALTLTLQKWGEERQKRKDAETLVFELAAEVAKAKMQRVADAGRIAQLQVQRVVDSFDSFTGGIVVAAEQMETLRGAHVAAPVPWWKRWRR